MAAREYGQYCGLARALDAVGDRWALLVVRDLLSGPHRFGELQTSLSRIPSNVLTNRLKELEAVGVVERLAAVAGREDRLTHLEVLPARAARTLPRAASSSRASTHSATSHASSACRVSSSATEANKRRTGPSAATSA